MLFTLPVDPVTRQPLDVSPLTLGASFRALGRTLTDTCLDDLCTGASCRGKPGVLRLTVNGIPQTDLDGYVWRDGDRLRLTFE